MNIVDIASGSDNFNILTLALTTASLDTTVRNATDITVFAPNDAAFVQLAVDLGYTGDQADETAVFNFIAGALAGLDPNSDPIPLLSDILTYHISPSVLDAVAVTNAGSIATLLTGADITPEVPVLRDLEPDLIDPALVNTDILADNGVIHEISRVLLPIDIPGNDAPTIAGLVAASGEGPDADNTDFDLLLAAVQTAGLDAVLDTDGLDATVFAPTDAAFIALAQDLGFTGTNEAGALNAIVATLTSLGGGDPIPLLTAILTYHVSPEAKQLVEVAALGDIPTLQGGTFTVSVTSLVDNEPDLTDPALAATDIQASNGIVHVIDRVLLPVDIPTSNGANDVKVLLGRTDGGRLTGAADNDLLIGGTALDDMRGNGGGDLFVLQNDGARDLIRDFEVGVDLIDVSSFADDISDLDITNLDRRDGSTNWISIADWTGEAEVIVRFGGDTPLDSGTLSIDSFVFANAPLPTPPATVVADTLELDDLRGTGNADIFEMLDDGVRDLIRGFEDGVDQIDVSAFASGIEDLAITNVVRRDDSVSWINVADTASENEFIVRFDGDTTLDAANLGADDFIFA